MTQPDLTAMPGDIALDLAAKFYQVANALVREADRHLATSGPVTFVQGLVLLVLATTDPMQPHHVADKLGQQPQSLTSMFDRLEREGLLTRVRDLPDRRAIRLELTAEGTAVAEGVRSDLGGWLSGIFTPADREHFGSVLSALQNALDSSPA